MRVPWPPWLKLTALRSPAAAALAPARVIWIPPSSEAIAGHTPPLRLCSWPLGLRALPLSDPKGYAGGDVAPSLLPPKPGARVQTERREAVPWARLARSGALTVVYVPKGAEEARRALTRAREAALRALPDAQVRLQACLLRHDSRCTGRANGKLAPRRWLADVGGGNAPWP
jgi:hypothetical protein